MSNRPSQSGKLTTAAVSVASLALVWGLVWANLPSKEELLSNKPQLRPAEPPAPSELDLTIPGVPSASPAAGLSPGTGQPSGSVSVGKSLNSAPINAVQAKQIAEIKCEAEIQRVCPDAFSIDEHRQCVELHLAQVSPACEDTVRRRLVRWKAASDYQTACFEDVARYCRDIRRGDETLVQCLQDHAQSVSDRCYQSLPKGTLHLKR